MKRALVGTIVSLIFSSTSLSQSLEDQVLRLFGDYKYYNSKEFAYLETDKPLYFSGESIQFSLFVLNQYFSPSELSRIAHMELVSENDQKENHRYSVRLKDGFADGIINLPKDFPTGNYQLIAYTSFMQNHDLQLLSHRIPIYVQNPMESLKPVVKNMKYESTKSDNGLLNLAVINTRSDEESLYVSIKSTLKDKEVILVSEGFKSIQFSAKIKLKSEIENIKFALRNFQGAFQRLILLDEDLNLLAVYPFFLQQKAELRHDAKTGAFITGGAVVNKLHLYHEDLDFFENPPDLFRRFYRIYYQIPAEVFLDDLTYNDLIAEDFMRTHAKYSIAWWKDILEKKRADSDVRILPEKNISIKGKVSGNQPIPEGASISLHFFKNGIDVSQSVDSSGFFDINLYVPTGEDQVKAILFSKDLEDISDGFNFTFKNSSFQPYLKNVSYFEGEYSKSYLERQKEFKYILSTFSNAAQENTLFWESLPFDQTFYVRNYQGLDSFEEFLREAVMNVSVVSVRGQKKIHSYNYKKGEFGTPLMLIVDGSVISDPSVLFETNLSDVEYVSVAVMQKTLSSVSSTFGRGIVVVKTKTSLEIPVSSLSSSFTLFTNYIDNRPLNSISDEYGNETILSLTGNQVVNYSLGESMKEGKYTVIGETIDTKGCYQLLIEKINK